MAKISLNEKQEKFLEVLFSDEVKGDPAKAKKLAGYSASHSTQAITTALADEIASLTRKFIANSATKAVYTMYNVLDKDADMLGVKERMLAAKDLLDRAGFVKTDKVEVTAKEPLFILPSKKSDDEE